MESGRKLSLHSDHEREINLFDAIAHIKSTVDRCVSSCKGSESRPETVSEADNRLVDLIFLDGPTLLRFLKRSIVQKFVTESVFFTGSLFGFLLLLAWAKMHVAVKAGQLNETKATESIIWLNTSNGVLLKGANRDDLALALDRADDVAESILFSQAVGWKGSLIERAFN